MSVLSDGTPYLNIRGLAAMCGVDHSSIVRITGDWLNDPLKPREKKIRELVKSQGESDEIDFYVIQQDGIIHHAIPAPVCMAILEYYTFEAKADNSVAADSFRLLARKAFRDFIYAQLSYNPTGSVSVAWQQFHDRIGLSYHTVPDGYFSVFKETSTILVTLIRQGADLGKSFIPDISIGLHWGKFWTAENLEVVYGERIQYEHNYPDYFLQALSNPQTPYCYLDDALAEFRKWLREVHLPDRLPKYLGEKVKQGQLESKKATAAIEAFKPKQISHD